MKNLMLLAFFLTLFTWDSQAQSCLQNTAEGSSLNTNMASSTPGDRRNGLGQTFKTCNPGKLKSISVKVPELLQGGKLKIQVYEFNASTKTVGKLLGTSNEAGYFKNQENLRTFATPITLNGNSNYAFVIASGTIFNISSATNNPYANGDAFKVITPDQSFNTINYNPVANIDLWFKMDYEEVAPPCLDNTAENSMIGSNMASSTPGDRRNGVGQTFKTCGAVSLKSISVRIPQLLQGGKLKIQVYEFNASTKTVGNLLGTSNEAGYFLNQENVRTFANPIALSANSTYAFVVASGTIFNLSSAKGNPYTNGDAFKVITSDQSFNTINYNPVAGEDLWFKMGTEPLKDMIVSCEGKEFKVDADKKIWEKINGNWTHVGDRCNQLYCNRRRVFCVGIDGSVWRYNGKAHDWTPANTLLAGQFLNGGDGTMGAAMHLQAANGKHFFYMQENGDLGLWTHNPQPKLTWNSGTHNKGANCTLHMQPDGNLVAYNSSQQPIWASNTMDHSANKAVKAVLEDDGKIVLYNNAGSKVWDNVKGKY